MTGDRLDSRLTDCVANLKSCGDIEPRKTLSILVSSVVHCDELSWLLGTCPPLTDQQLSDVESLCEQRASGFPLQYLIGYAWFFGSRYKVGPNVLVPRPDTEVLVQAAGEILTEKYTNTHRPLRFMDVGTGSGCVGITLAKRLDRQGIPYEAILTEMSESAMDYARINLEHHHPICPVHLILCDLFPASGAEAVDVVVSNPPYIPHGDIECLMPEVSTYEPRQALDGGPDGLEVIRRIVSGASVLLNTDGQLLIEHGYDQGESVRALFRETGIFSVIRTLRDFEGRNRVTIGSLCNA